jgi:transposase InsO family protein
MVALTPHIPRCERGSTSERPAARRSLTRPDKSARKAPDLLQRRFEAPQRPDEAWVGDLTELPNDEGRFYLADVLDLHSRRCVGFAAGPRVVGGDRPGRSAWSRPPEPGLQRPSGQAAYVL